MITELRKSYVFRLKPTDEQKQKFLTFSHASIYIYNWGLAYIKDIQEKRKVETDPEKLKELKTPSAIGFTYLLTELKKQDDHQWLNDIPVTVLRASLTDLAMGMQHFFRRIKNKETPGFPRFKSRHFDNSLRVLSTKVHNNYVFIAKIGWVQFIKSRDLIGLPKQATVKRDGKNWYVAISCVASVDVPVITTQRTCELTLKIDEQTAYVMKDGQKLFSIGGYTEKQKKRMVGIQTKLSLPKIKESTSRLKTVEKLKTIHRKHHVQRKDLQHKISTSLIQNYDIIRVEKHPIKDLMKQESYCRALAELGWSMFVNMLIYKSQWAGKHVYIGTDNVTDKKVKNEDHRSVKETKGSRA